MRRRIVVASGQNAVGRKKKRKGRPNNVNKSSASYVCHLVAYLHTTAEVLEVYMENF